MIFLKLLGSNCGFGRTRGPPHSPSCRHPATPRLQLAPGRVAFALKPRFMTRSTAVSRNDVGHRIDLLRSAVTAGAGSSRDIPQSTHIPALWARLAQQFSLRPRRGVPARQEWGKARQAGRVPGERGARVTQTEHHARQRSPRRERHREPGRLRMVSGQRQGGRHRMQRASGRDAESIKRRAGANAVDVCRILARPRGA